MKSLFADPKAKSAETAPSMKTFERRPRAIPTVLSLTGDSWLTCGMTVFMADPNIDRKSLIHSHSIDAHAVRRVEPKVCK